MTPQLPILPSLGRMIPRHQDMSNHHIPQRSKFDRQESPYQLHLDSCSWMLLNTIDRNVGRNVQLMETALTNRNSLGHRVHLLHTDIPAIQRHQRLYKDIKFALSLSRPFIWNSLACKPNKDMILDLS